MWHFLTSRAGFNCRSAPSTLCAYYPLQSSLNFFQFPEYYWLIHILATINFVVNENICWEQFSVF
jgi:hypothetical protein